MTTALHTVHVRVNDAATGQPTPVRLRITDPDGTYYAPFGRLKEFATGWNEDVGGNLLHDGKRYAYIDGTCEIRLPPGRILVEASKGPEYLPLRREVVIGPGKLALRLAIERWTDLRPQGWYSGDIRAHILTPHAALLEGAAEDLAVVNLLAAPCRIPVFDEVTDAYRGTVPAIPNVLAFSGQHPALALSGHLVVVNTHNRHPELGSLGLLNCHRAVYPLYFGGPVGSDNWTLADWCDQCHRKGGLVIWTELEDYGRHGERLADLIVGKIDAVEAEAVNWPTGEYGGHLAGSLAEWYKFLRAGLRVPLVGASGKTSNKTALGTVRTYAHLQPGEGLNYPSWIEAVRVGRTFVTSGPLLTLTADGQEPGAVLNRTGPAPIVHVRAEARSVSPFDRLEVVTGGTVVATASPTGSPAAAVVEADVPVGAGTWLAARCSLIGKSPISQRWLAHTSPIYVTVDGQPLPADPVATDYLARQLETMLEWVHNHGRFENEGQRDHLLDIFRTAWEELAKRRGS